MVIIKEKDGAITKGKRKIYIEGPYVDMDREMWVSNRIIALDDIIDIEPCDFGILNESVFNINNNKQR